VDEAAEQVSAPNMAELAVVKGANIRVAAPLGEGWEYRQHGFLVPLARSAGAARRALFVAVGVWGTRTGVLLCKSPIARHGHEL